MAENYWSSVLGKRTGRRQTLAVSGAAGLGVMLLAACGRNSGGLKLDDSGSSRQPGTVWFAKNNWRLADETKEAAGGGIYRGVATDDPVGHFDAIALMSSQVPSSLHVHEMLMSQNRGPGIEPGSVMASRPVGALAESWEIAPDGATITFKMRSGVKFHPIPPVNGRVMDMDDWKTSLEHHLELGPFRADLQNILAKSEFPDARTMVWKLNAPYAAIFERIYLDKFAYPIQPKELNTNSRLAESTIIGTGFKILDKYQPAIGFEYRRNPEYWGGDPFIDRWHVPIIPEYSNRYAQFVLGNIMDLTPTARDVSLLAKDAPKAVIIAEPIPADSATRMRFGAISPDEQPTADPRVRVAIRRSIDFKAIGELLSNKAQLEAAGVPVELSPMTHLPQNPSYWLNPEKGELGKLSDNYLYNPAEAKKLTAAAGFNAPIPLFFPISLSQGVASEADQLVIDSFKAAGTFSLDVLNVPSAEYNKYRTFREFDGLHGSQSGTTNDADYFLFLDYYSGGRPGVRSGQAYTNPKLDLLAEAQRREMDIEKRIAILKEIQVFMAEWMPSIPGRHLYTTFRFRWPWQHNSNYGETGSPPEGRPAQGGHLHWLDANMPNRDKPI